MTNALAPTSRRPSWHWLLLLAPALEWLLVRALSNMIAPFLGISDQYGFAAVIAYDIPVAALLCFVVGFWWTRGGPRRISKGLSYGLLVLALNIGFAFVGCTALR